MAYAELEQQAQAVAAALPPAEAHGLLCGLLGGALTDPVTLWLSENLDNCDAADLRVTAYAEALRTLALTTQAALEEPGLGFSLLLPDDAQPLPERAAALRNWTQGFLYGLGLSGTNAAWPLEAHEALTDLAQIVQADTETLPDDAAEDDEVAYTELVEFVWVAALWIRELRPTP